MDERKYQWMDGEKHEWVNSIWNFCTNLLPSLLVSSFPTTWPILHSGIRMTLLKIKVFLFCVQKLLKHFLSSNNAGVPNPWDLMPDDMRWSWHNNSRNKVHNKCNAFESSQNHTPPTASVKKFSSMTPVCGAERLETGHLMDKSRPSWLTIF